MGMETTENKYRKDVAEPEANMNSLDELFDVSMEQTEIIDGETGEVINTTTGEVLDKVKGMRKELKELEGELPNVDKIIENNGRLWRFR